MHAPAIWVAEDNDDVRTSIAEYLRHLGYCVQEFADGLSMANAMWEVLEIGGCYEAPELVLSDLRLPGCDGLALCAMLRRTDWKTPVVLMTAYGDREVYRQADRLGVLAVLDKPFDLKLLASIARPFAGCDDPPLL
jgi:two-component system, response regulator, stage 0 sporulation protein F